MKKFRLTAKKVKVLLIWISVISLAVILNIMPYIMDMRKPVDEPPEIVSTVNTENADIEITAEELQAYRENIGNGMDVKKSILIIFNTFDECQSFINEHGSNNNILSLGKGIIPEMQGDGEKYFNVVGNSVFESLFENMSDGEYLKEPTEFGGAYCYFKRLKKTSITDNDEAFTEFIKHDKAMRQKGGTAE